MIYVEVSFALVGGGRKTEERRFDDCRKALRFMYGMKRKGNRITGWRTDDPDDNEYLWERFHG